MQRTVLHSTTHCNLRSQNGRQSAYKPAKVAGFVSRSDIFAKHSQLRSSVVAHAGGITDVDEATLEFEVANRDRPLIIDFYATWCGPCVLMNDELKKVAAEVGEGVKILKLDTDKYPGISTALQIQGLPTLVFVGMDQNKPALRTEGLIPAATIMEILTKEIGYEAAAGNGSA